MTAASRFRNAIISLGRPLDFVKILLNRMSILPGNSGGIQDFGLRGAKTWIEILKGSFCGLLFAGFEIDVFGLPPVLTNQTFPLELNIEMRRFTENYRGRSSARGAVRVHDLWTTGTAFGKKQLLGIFLVQPVGTLFPVVFESRASHFCPLGVRNGWRYALPCSGRLTLLRIPGWTG